MAQEKSSTSSQTVVYQIMPSVSTTDKTHSLMETDETPLLSFNIVTSPSAHVKCNNHFPKPTNPRNQPPTNPISSTRGDGEQTQNKGGAQGGDGGQTQNKGGAQCGDRGQTQNKRDAQGGDGGQTQNKRDAQGGDGGQTQKKGGVQKGGDGEQTQKKGGVQGGDGGQTPNK